MRPQVVGGPGQLQKNLERTDNMDAMQCREKMKALGCCVIVPTYNNAGTLAAVLSEVLEYAEDVIVVNDGSTDGTAAVLHGFGHRIRILTHPFNWGKGAALLNAMESAHEAGFSHAVTIDSDGQHYPSDLPAFAVAIEACPEAILVGARNLQADGMPGKNTFANRFSNFWFRLETGIRLDDTQSGFRAYPLDRIPLSGRLFTGGYEFEIEMLVFSAWRGTAVKNIPVNVCYRPEGGRVSHFRPFRDFAKISILNTLLVLYCILWKWPVNLIGKLSWKNFRKFIDSYIMHSPDSNARLSSAIALGVFIGVVPIWGYQMIAAIALAHLLRLNKAVAVVASNISIPPVIPFILFGSYWTGCRMLGQPVLIAFKDMTLQSVGGMLLQYVLGSIVFGAVLAAVFWTGSMLMMTMFHRQKERRRDV